MSIDVDAYTEVANRKSIGVDSFANDDKTIKELKLLEEHATTGTVLLVDFDRQNRPRGWEFTFCRTLPSSDPAMTSVLCPKRRVILPRWHRYLS